MNKKKSQNLFAENSAICVSAESPGYLIRGEIWLEKNGRIFVDSNRVKLLHLIDEHGSLAAAARSMRIGYNTAWLWIMDMNRLSSYPLVKRGSGGVNGGYSLLTDQGHKVMEEYNTLNSRLRKVTCKTDNLQPL
jgi:molybdate transport system regulatory protein